MMTDLTRAIHALECIPSEDRDTWLRMAMALKSEFGDTAFEAWENWSQSAESFNARDAHNVWKGLRADGKVKIGTLFYEARSRGWQPAQAPGQSSLQRENPNTHLRKVEDEASRTRELAVTAHKAHVLWNAAGPARTDNAYLIRKGVRPTSTLREIRAEDASKIIGYPLKSSGVSLEGSLLVVPIKVANRLSSIELIAENGMKAALAGRGSKTGGYWCSQRLPEEFEKSQTLLIAEGVATGLTAAEATGFPAVAALSAQNLRKVVEALRLRYPAANLIVLADLSKKSGMADERAIHAARSIGARLAIPDFGDVWAPGANDFNDLARLNGLVAVSRAIDVAKPVTGPLGIDTRADVGYRRNNVVLRLGSDIAPSVIQWVWQGWLAQGKIHVLGGAPGTGKTTIAMAFAAAVSTGGRWPDGSKSPRGAVVIWSGEDDPADTLIPRLQLAGADMDNIYFVEGVDEANKHRSFDPASDMALLRQRIAEIREVRMLVIDPIVSAIGGDSHKNAEVRRGLQPLVELAAAMKCAVLGITHFTKGTAGREPVERITGSLAFGALARVVFVAAKRQGEAEPGKSARIFLRAKSNIGQDDGGFEYDLVPGQLDTNAEIHSSYVRWRGAIAGTARELLAIADAAEVEDVSSALSEAEAFLSTTLSNVPMAVKTLRAESAEAGHSWTTIKRAKDRLGVKASKESMTGGWSWTLKGRSSTESEDAHRSSMSTFGPNEHLRDSNDVVAVSTTSAEVGNLVTAATEAAPLAELETGIAEAMHDEELPATLQWLSSLGETDAPMLEALIRRRTLSQEDEPYLEIENEQTQDAK